MVNQYGKVSQKIESQNNGKLSSQISMVGMQNVIQIKTAAPFNFIFLENEHGKNHRK